MAAAFFGRATPGTALPSQVSRKAMHADYLAES